MTYIYELTNYPKIFKNVYWGNFKTPSSCATENIINERNIFIETYKVKLRPKNKPKIILQYLDDIEKHLKDIVIRIFDHIECYYTEDKKYILVSSPYNHVNNDKLYNVIGWNKIEKLYCQEANTYIKIFDSLQDVKFQHKLIIENNDN